jgi:uncharacterized protein (DUF1697 family)
VFAAFLRGMNVGGHRLTNAELRSHFDAMGFSEVATFRASGNVVFAAKLVDASKGKLRVALLIAAPSAKARGEVLALASDQDRLDVVGRELFWLPQGGVRDSPLDWKAIERLLGVSTMRTKNTLDQIAARHLPA